MKAYVALVLLCIAGASANAQSSSATDSMFRRARRLVAEGNGAAGRAMVDSLLRKAEEGSTEYGNALYWHGALAETAADAERDYRKVIVEYSSSAYVDDALLAIAELEQARGDRAAALEHLQRFVREHPVAAPSRGIAAFAAARLAFEQRDTRVACGLISDARASTPSTNVELLNQIGYYANRCPAAGVQVASVPDTATPKPAAPARVVTTPPPKAKTSSAAKTPNADASASVAKARADSVRLARAAADSIVAMGRARADSVRLARADSVRRALVLRDSSTALGMTTTALGTTRAAPGTTRTATAANPAPTGAALGVYTIQVAAYNTREDAERLVAKLKAKDVKARVSGTEKPFRVRLDFYPTRAAALAEVASLKTRGIVGFVTEEQPLPVKGVR